MALVCYLLAFLWNFPSMDRISFHHFLYLLLILDSLISFWWITCAWSSSQLVALNQCTFSWITLPSLFFFLWIPPHLLLLWWQHWSLIKYIWDWRHIALVCFHWYLLSVYWCEQQKNHLGVSNRWLFIYWQNWQARIYSMWPYYHTTFYHSLGPSPEFGWFWITN